MTTINTTFSSETKIQILRTLSYETRAYSAEELEEVTTKNIAAVYNGLNALKDEGILTVVQTEGNTKNYRLETNNPQNLYAKSIGQLFQTEREMLGLERLPSKPLNIVTDFKKKLLNQVEGLELVILFGSGARGEYTLGSDLDLYIVLEEKSKELEDQIYDISFEYDHEFSLIIKSREEFEEEFSKPPTDLAQSIIKQGYSALHGDDSELEKYETSTSKLGEGKLGEDKLGG